jgi:G:T/U-mismatch repair DNA glycosylase
MKIVFHKFKDHIIHVDTETLIIGTFNPNALGNSAEFFYGRSRNNLWKLLPIAFYRENLKDKSIDGKIEFSKANKIDFTDLISSVTVEKGQEINYDDHYLDSRVREWTDIISIIDNLKSIKRVCFTRKSFSGIPRMKERILEIENYCKLKSIEFGYLVTPARFYSAEKQAVWNEFFRNP